MPASAALANSIDLVGTHRLIVGFSATIELTSIPFSDSATGSGPGGWYLRISSFLSILASPEGI
jgi:hypothetical protein